MINEYYSECLNLKVYIDDSLNTVKVNYLDSAEEETHDISTIDVGNINTAFAVPSFSWGSIMLQIGRAIERAIGSGSSSK